MVQPVSNEKLCRSWASLPPGRCYLAATVADLKDIMETEGDSSSSPPRISEGIVWYTPDQLFEACRCGNQAQVSSSSTGHRHSDFGQILFPSGLARLLPQRSPVQLDCEGAVIFGYSPLFKWIWPDTGEPMRGEPETISQAIIEKSTTQTTTDHEITSLEPNSSSGNPPSTPDTSLSAALPEETEIKDISQPATPTMAMASQSLPQNRGTTKGLHPAQLFRKVFHTLRRHDG